MDPILDLLEQNLKEFFQKPIHDLNEQTKESWRKTISAARWGFSARMIMSCIVFFVGITLLIISSYKFLSGDLSGTQIWGTSASFASGLASMLLVIYTGPLKDIRQAVSDLGASSAAFIAYVHRILQISHTFSAKYLRQEITYEDTEKSSKLLGEAMNDTIMKLQYETKKEIKRAAKKVK